MEMVLHLPWPPSVNHYKQVGAIVRTKTGKLYQKRINKTVTVGFYYNAYVEAKKAMPLEWAAVARSEAVMFGVRVCLHPPDNRRRDIDNGLKVILDSLVHAHVIHDDSQITRLLVQKLDIIKPGKVIVTIEPIGEF